MVAGASDSWRQVLCALLKQKKTLSTPALPISIVTRGCVHSAAGAHFPLSSLCLPFAAHVEALLTFHIPALSSGLLWLFSLHSCKPYISPGSSQPCFHFLHASFLCFSFGRSCVFIDAGLLLPLLVWIEMVQAGGNKQKDHWNHFLMQRCRSEWEL